MATAVWPPGLPMAPSVNTWTETPLPGGSKFESEVGPPKLRRRTTAVPYRSQCSFILTRLERDAFEAWWADTLAAGSLPFSWRHPMSGITHRWIFDAEPEMAEAGLGAVRVSVALIRLP